MNDVNNEAFISLFKEAFKKCFGFELTASLSETESKHFGNKIFEDTGLVIGAKSLKNYSGYILNSAESKHENPSVATLDTLARYVLNAPETDEVKRKDKESHYPYWFQYKNTLSVPAQKEVPKKGRKQWILISIVIIAAIALFLVTRLFYAKADEHFTDHFHTVDEDTLTKNGWFVRSKDTTWWNRRNEKPSSLTLFTLRGDNWPDSVNTPAIKNLLLRKISSDCFSAEIHFNSFMPKANWQQAGILLMEDTVLTSKTVRLSIAYNDFFGGFSRPKEIIIQGVSSGGKDLSQPEEIAHIAVFSIQPGQEPIVNENLKYSALRIEKNENHFRFLYSASPLENFAFKEAFAKDLSIKPNYIGIFALDGFVNDTNYIPAHVTFFSLVNSGCEK